MMKAGQIAFSAVPVAIVTSSGLNPPPVVVDDRVPSNGIFMTTRETDEKKRGFDSFREREEDGLRAEYDTLMQQIRGD
jgi:hypothetical protein